MKTHLKTVGVMLLFALWVWGVAVTDGALIAFTVCGVVLVMLYYAIYLTIQDRERKRR